jgi:hypothetical protein
MTVSAFGVGTRTFTRDGGRVWPSRLILDVMADFGARGDGIADDSAAFQAALDAVPASGGVVRIPPAPSGVYLIGRCLRHRSRTMVWGSGPGSLLKSTSDFVAATTYGGTSMWLNANADGSETSFAGYRDFQIAFENVWIDNTDHPSPAGHGIFHRAAQCVKIINCRLIAGGDATAAVTCDDHLVFGCTAIGQTNCTYDHWGGTTNFRVIGCYGRLGEAATGQIINANGIRTSQGGGATETWVTDGGLFADNDLFSNSATQRSINLEPLGPNSAVRNIRISNNRFNDGRVIISNATSGIILDGNHFTKSRGTSPTIWARSQFAGFGDTITVQGNQFMDCDGPAGMALIDIDAPGATVIGNYAKGGVYDYGTRFRSGYFGVFLANSFPDAAISDVLGIYGAGRRVQVPHDGRFMLLDADGLPAYLTVSADTNTLALVGTNGSGGNRTIWSITQGSATSSFRIFPNVSLSGRFRQSLAIGLEATGSTRTDALPVTVDRNVFATVAAGTGCILPASNEGGVIEIINDGANALNNYPPSGGQIVGLSVNEPDTIASGGASKRYLALTANTYRILP